MKAKEISNEGHKNKLGFDHLALLTVLAVITIAADCRYAAGQSDTNKKKGNLGDRLIEGAIQAVTPDADEATRKIQRDAVKFVVDPNQKRSEQHLNDMIKHTSEAVDSNPSPNNPQNGVPASIGAVGNDAGVVERRTIHGGNLVAYFPFHHDANDASQNGNDGRIRGNVFASGSSNTENMHLRGSGDCVTVRDKPEFRMEKYSICVWVKLEEVSDATGCATLVRKQWAGSRHSFSLYVVSSSGRDDNYGGVRFPALAPVMASYSRNGAGTAYGQKAVRLNEWTHLVGTYDGRNMRIYMNGSLVGAYEWGGVPAYDDSPIAIGGNFDEGCQWVNGNLKELRIYNRALSGEEIQRLYKLR